MTKRESSKAANKKKRSTKPREHLTLNGCPITKKELLENPVAIAVYEINHRKITFKVTACDGDAPYGYCYSRGWWAYLFPGFIDVAGVGFVPAKQLTWENS